MWECYADFGGHGTIWKLFLRFQQNLLGFLLPLPRHDLLLLRWLCAGEAEAPGPEPGPEDDVALVVAFFVLWFPYNLTLFLHSLLDLQVFGDCRVSQHLDYALQVARRASPSCLLLHPSSTPSPATVSASTPRLSWLLCSEGNRPCRPAILSESSGLTSQEDVMGMSDLGERQAESFPNKGTEEKLSLSSHTTVHEQSLGPSPLVHPPKSSLQRPQ